jgi:FeS assembly protein IscX
MRWDDVEEICETLAKVEPPVDPRGMTEEEIVELVITLPSFEGDVQGFNAGHIEAVRAGVWWGA